MVVPTSTSEVISMAMFNYFDKLKHAHNFLQNAYLIKS